ncbi:hypothetical protein Bca101_009374 [Brassica carinata]
MRKPVSYRELPREGRPQTLNDTIPTASNKNPEHTRAKNLNTRPKKGHKIEITGGMRRSRDPTMPSFSSLHQRLPPPLHSTGTVYTHLTATHIEKTDPENDNPPEKTNPKPHSDPSDQLSHQRTYPSRHSLTRHEHGVEERVTAHTGAKDELRRTGGSQTPTRCHQGPQRSGPTPPPSTNPHALLPRENTPEAPQKKIERHELYRRGRNPELQLNKQPRTPPDARPEEEHETNKELDSAAHASTLGGEDQNAREKHRRDLARCRMKRDSRRNRPQASQNATVLDLSSVKPDLMRWTTTPSSAENRDDRGEEDEERVSSFIPSPFFSDSSEKKEVEINLSPFAIVLLKFLRINLSPF